MMFHPIEKKHTIFSLHRFETRMSNWQTQFLHKVTELQLVSLKTISVRKKHRHLLYICRMSHIIHRKYVHMYISLSKKMGNVNRRTSCENRHWKLLQSRKRIRRSLGTAVCFHPGSGTVGQVMSCNTALVKARGIPSSISKLTNCNLFFNMSMILIQFRLFFNMSSFIKSKHLDTTRLIRSRWVTKGIDHLGFNLTPSGVCAVAVIKSQETAAARQRKPSGKKPNMWSLKVLQIDWYHTNWCPSRSDSHVGFFGSCTLCYAAWPWTKRTGSGGLPWLTFSDENKFLIVKHQTRYPYTTVISQFPPPSAQTWYSTKHERRPGCFQGRLKFCCLTTGFLTRKHQELPFDHWFSVHCRWWHHAFSTKPTEGS